MRPALGAAAGIVADLLLGEPPIEPHPVSLYGNAMRRVERSLYGDSRGRGVVHAAVGTALGALAGGAIGSTGVATYVVVAAKGLADAARTVDVHLDRGDLSAARGALQALVGRDPSSLDEKGIARAVVESVAENTVDAIVAPALWAAVGGAPAAGAYRAINTLDSMVGHTSERYLNYGWASARLDDAAAYVPARLTALLVAAARPQAAREVWRVVRRDAAAHPSPNAGVAEAAFAAALGLRLGGPSTYGDRVELRPPLGHGRPAEPDDIVDAIRLSRDVALLLAAILGAVGAVGGLSARAARRRRRTR